MPNRYTRDELIKIAIDMAQVPNLKVHDVPNGVVQPDAYSIQWLQDIIDFWYHAVPFSLGVTSTALNITNGVQAIATPADFVLDVRDGYVIQTTDASNSKKRLKRLSLQKWITADLAAQNSTTQYPLFYMVQGRYIKVTPTPSSNRTALLWYYFLPPVLQSDDVPSFTSDYPLIEYIRIRALEWCGHFEPGTAQKFCDKIVASLKASGLMNEPEGDVIPIESNFMSVSNRDVYSWMGAR